MDEMLVVGALRPLGIRHRAGRMMALSEPEAALDAGGFMRSVCPVDFDAICAAARKASAARKGVLLSGASGSGKTHAMRCLCPPPPPFPARTRWVHFERDHEVEWLGTGALEGEYAELDAIVLDDLGMEGERCSFGEWRDNVAKFFADFQRFVDRGNMVPRIFVTTNLSSVMISERYGDRVMSRLLSLVVPVKMSGRDKRVVGL